jgi:tetratricopeptide (TPR) repeat protein
MRNKPIIKLSNVFSLIFLLPLLLSSFASAAGHMTEAALQGDAKALDKKLRRNSPEINAGELIKGPQSLCPDETVLTPLQAASCAGHAAIVEKLLEAKAIPDLPTSKGKTPLLLAVNTGKNDVARLLVERGAKTDLADADGNTPLIVALKRENLSLAEFLLKNGASPQNRNRDGETALMLASDAKMAKMLLDAGADPMQKNSRGESAMLIGTRSGNADTAALFRDLQESMRKAVDQEMDGGDLAVEKGRFDEASSRYSAAIAKAAGLGGPAMMDVRIRMLKKVNGLPDQPVLSEKAREHLVRSSYVLKNSQNLDQAEKEVAAALNTDPWWLDGYYNIGILQAKLSRFEIAEENLAIYIAAAPPGPKTQGAQDKIYEIRMAKEEAEKISGVTGNWVDGGGRTYNVAIDGSNLRISSSTGLAFSLTINNNIIKGSVEGGASSGPNGCTFPGQIHPVNGNLDPDANGMSLEYLWSSYDTKFHYVNMFGAPVTGKCLTCGTKCDAVNIIATNTTSLRLVRSGGGQAGGNAMGERIIRNRAARGR